MQRDPRPDGPGFTSPQRGRCMSLSVDGPSHLLRSTILTPPLVNPRPQYIAASSAAQIVATDQEIEAFDHAGHPGGVLVTPDSLTLLNGFLDHLLFNILLAARSTKLIAIRPAISEVLKPRLAKEVVSAADDELRAYTGGGDEDELSSFHGGQEPAAGHFELERSWKLTRLRCMVYTRLGDLEEEDEEGHLHREGLDDDGGYQGRFSSNVGHITPAAAIFLTSVLEYLGESSLIIAGEAAYVRMSSGTPMADQLNALIVEEADVERLALNPTLGRLWRTWRKNARVPRLSRTLSRESIVQRGRLRSKTSSRQSSIATFDQPLSEEPSEASTEESVDPAGVPLPLTDYDVDEIEVPGYKAEFAVVIPAKTVRPRSLFVASPGPTTPTSTTSREAARTPETYNRAHSRSFSLPGSAYYIDAQSPASTASETASKTSKGDTTPLAMMPEDEEPRQSTKDTSQSSHSTVPTIGHQTMEDLSDIDERFEDALSSSVSSLDASDHGLVAPSDISAGPSPITNEEAEIFQRRTRSRPSSAAGSPGFPDGQRAMTSSEPHPVTHSTANYPRTPRGGRSPPIVETSFVSSRSESQPPRLTPLREMVYAAAGTPDEERPHGPRRSESLGAQEPVSASAESTVSHTSHVRSSKYSRSSQVSTPRYMEPAAGSERAAVQRVTPPPTSLQRNPSSVSHRSESAGSSRDRRPVTSGSGTSQVSSKIKGIVGRQSSETGCTQVGTTEHTRKQSNLDQLIRSDETIRYTLTPRNMREMEDPDSPRWQSVRADSLEITALPVQSPKSSSDAPKSGGGMKTLSKHKSMEQTTRKPSYQSARPKTAAYQPREARSEMESMRDFADFIKSTGPPQTGASPGRQIPNGNKSQPNTPGAAPSPVRSAYSQPARDSASTTRRAGPKLEARPAAVPSDRQTSDLIDFIREGPPRDGSHRISRNVAPFRTTMDSDDFRPYSSVASLQASSMNTKSVNSSTNSRTGLLEGTKPMRSAAPPSKLESIPSPTSNFEQQAPIRRKRGPRDPYAIDVSDESELEDEDDSALFNEPPAKKEESLADFLRNAPPPPDDDEPPRQLLLSTPPTNGTKPRSKSLNMRARLRRTASSDRVPKPKISLSSLHSSRSANHPSPLASHAPPPLPPTPRIYSQRQNPVSNSSNYSAQVSGPNRNPPQRPAGRYQSETSALADFLKNTAPPEPVRAPISASSIDDDRQGSVLKSSTLGKMFMRKKKQQM